MVLDAVVISREPSGAAGRNGRDGEADSSGSKGKAEEDEEDEEDVEDEDDGEACEGCGKTSDGANMLLCDGPGPDGNGCEVACHLYCCVPPLKSMPDGDWLCPSCVKATVPQPFSSGRQVPKVVKPPSSIKSSSRTAANSARRSPRSTASKSRRRRSAATRAPRRRLQRRRRWRQSGEEVRRARD